MDQIFTTQFWHDQWTVITSAPWLVIPSLIVAGFVGWKWKGVNDDGEMRGLRQEVSVAAQRLQFANEKFKSADEKYQTVVNQINELNNKVAQQNSITAGWQRELNRRSPQQVPELNELVLRTKEIKNVLTNLSTSTASLGQTLQEARKSFATSPSAADSV